MIRRRTGLLVLAAVAAVLALTLLLRAGLMMAGGGDAAAPPAPWMTPRFIARTYGLPPEAVARALNLTPGSAPRKSLAEIAEETGRPVADLLRAIEAETAARR